MMQGPVTHATVSAGGIPFPPGFTKRFVMTTDSSVLDAPMTNLVVALKLSTAAGITSNDLSAIFTEIGASYLKIAITDWTGTNQLYGEVEDWNAGPSNAVVHVRFPSIPDTWDTNFYFNYDSGADDNVTYIGVTNSVPAQTVWPAEYLAVYHLAEEGVSTRYDSTIHTNHSTPVNYDGDEATTGFIDGADALNGVDDAQQVLANQAGGHVFTNLSDCITLSAWINPGAVAVSGGTSVRWWMGYTIFELIRTDYSHVPFGWGISSSVMSLGATVNSTSTDERKVGTNTISIGAYQHVAVTVDGDTVQFYYNGEPENVGTFMVAVSDRAVNQEAAYLRIGANNNSSAYNKFFNDVLDEARIIEAVHTPAQIKADYNSGIDKLITYSEE